MLIWSGYTRRRKTMDKILKRDLLGDMSDADVREKHSISSYRQLRQLWMKARGYNIKVD